MIKLVILDVDGCLCDGKSYDKNHKTTGKNFNDLDFTAIKCFKALGIPVVLLTSDTFNVDMAKKRKIKLYDGNVDGKINKLKVFFDIKRDYGVTDSQCVYLGDDRFDVPVLEEVRFSFCPSNSPDCVKEVCSVTLRGRSGENLVSEIFDWCVASEYLKEPSLETLTKIDSEEK